MNRVTIETKVDKEVAQIKNFRCTFEYEGSLPMGKDQLVDLHLKGFVTKIKSDCPGYGYHVATAEVMG